MNLNQYTSIISGAYRIAEETVDLISGDYLEEIKKLSVRTAANFFSVVEKEELDELLSNQCGVALITQEITDKIFYSNKSTSEYTDWKLSAKFNHHADKDLEIQCIIHSNVYYVVLYCYSIYGSLVRRLNEFKSFSTNGIGELKHLEVILDGIKNHYNVTKIESVRNEKSNTFKIKLEIDVSELIPFYEGPISYSHITTFDNPDPKNDLSSYVSLSLDVLEDIVRKYKKILKE